MGQCLPVTPVWGEVEVSKMALDPPAPHCCSVLLEPV